MGKFVISPHFRLHEWVAEEKGYFRAEAEELFVSDIGISPRLSAEQYGEIYQEIAETLGQLLEQEPRAGEWLRDRTFARTLH